MTAHKMRSEKLIDLAGNRYGKLVVIKYVGDLKWMCRCDCGNVTTQKGQKLREGKRKSCGCTTRSLHQTWYDGRKRSIPEISKLSGINLQTLYQRYARGARGKELVCGLHPGTRSIIDRVFE